MGEIVARTKVRDMTYGIHRRYHPPRDADLTGATATLAHGILTLVVPKRLQSEANSRCSPPLAMMLRATARRKTFRCARYHAPQLRRCRRLAIKVAHRSAGVVWGGCRSGGRVSLRALVHERGCLFDTQHTSVLWTTEIKG